MRTKSLLPTDSIGVVYGQVYVESGGDPPDADMEANFRGQAQGLCGAKIPGSLFLLTGLHTGRVGFRLFVHASEPPIDESFEDIVEVSFRPKNKRVKLVEWSAQAIYDFKLEERDYRVRYSARKMDAGHDADTSDDSDTIVDEYVLEFWPALTSPERIVKQTSAQAAYWHKYARDLS